MKNRLREVASKANAIREEHFNVNPIKSDAPPVVQEGFVEKPKWKSAREKRAVWNSELRKISGLNASATDINQESNGPSMTFVGEPRYRCRSEM
jgi:hypothetical protein